MYYEKAKDTSKDRQFIDSFGGLNHALRIADNEFYDIKNMSAENYPLLSSRPTFKGGALESDTNIKRGTCYNDGKVWFVYEGSGSLKLDYIGNTGSAYTLGTVATANVGAERTLINFGAKIVVFPDKMYFNTADVTDYGTMEKSFNNLHEENHYNWWYVVKPCDIDGNEYKADYYGSTEPQSPTENYVWYDTANQVIKVWESAYSMWVTPTIYHKYRIESIAIFNDGESVRFTCYRNGEEYVQDTVILKAFHNPNATPQTDDNVPLDQDYVIIPATDDTKIHWANWYDGSSYTGVLYNKWRSLICFEQIVPQMDYVTECQGRLWGCRYGDTVTKEIKEYRTVLDRVGTEFAYQFDVNFLNFSKDEHLDKYISYWAYDDDFNKIDSITMTDGYEGNFYVLYINDTNYSGTSYHINIDYSKSTTKKVNEIYSSKQQDISSWNYFQGTALDSYTVSIGASGEFTGAVNFNGRPLFSKEDRMYQIYGNYPAQYQLAEYVFEGVENGAYKSMVVYNGVLYYKGRHGIYAYSGSLPQKIDKFGGLKFANTKAIGTKTENCCCAGAYNGVYYINLENANYGGIYTYDTEKGIWHRLERSKVPIWMVSVKDKILALQTFLLRTVAYSEFDAIEDDNDTSSWNGSWIAETGTLGLSNPDEKYFEKITIRYKGNATIKINYDSEVSNGATVWNTVTTVSGGTKSQTYSINPKRCDHFRLRFDGIGEFYLYSIAITVETGSDVTNG